MTDLNEFLRSNNEVHVLALQRAQFAGVWSPFCLTNNQSVPPLFCGRVTNSEVALNGRWGYSFFLSPGVTSVCVSVGHTRGS